MGFLNDLLNKIRQNPEEQQQTGGIMPAVNMQAPVQSGNALTDAINTAAAPPAPVPVVNRPQINGAVNQSDVIQPPAAPPVNETMQTGTPQPPQPQTPEQGVMNGLKNRFGGSKLYPSNWDDNTIAKVKLVSDYLGGFAATPYNPQAGIWSSVASGLAGANNGLKAGISNINNYNQAKELYKQMGLDPNSLSINGDYSQMTPDKLVSLGIRNKQLQVRQDLANAKNNTDRLKIIMDGLKNGTMEPAEAEAQAKVYGIDFANLQDSNQTRATDSKVKLDGQKGELIGSQIKVNDARIKKINADIKQNQQKIGILQQRVNQGRATASDKAVLNQLNIQNKKLLIEQNTLINQGMRDQMGGGSGGGGARPVGQQRGGKVF